ncbi:DUF6600 domain-containing protein [Sorangium sp. So ce291]|uniref:DUF6600 domain-containing protein n=1 Tax=Sorangium sp. So ce291 TaxID=3133294 RepID=UPI003F5D789F
MLPMPLPPSSSRLLPAPAAAPASARAKLRRLGGALPLLAALVAAPSSAAAQGLPQGYTSDAPGTAGETAPSQAPETQPVQVEVGVSAEVAVDDYEDTDPSALVEFHEPLAPYGAWVDDPSYGRVWVPSAVVVGPDFAPYQSAGHWSLTDDGEWMWVSDYEWGHIPFHYGRWVWISAHGWAWIPGRVYAPAWVVWRVGDYGYVGWAPTPPTYYWSGGVAVSLWTVPPAAYVFCPTTHVFHRHVHTHVIRDREVVRRIASHSHPYRPARPTVGSPGRGDARSGGAGRPSSPHGIRPGSYRPASPSLAEAGVPSSAAPKLRGRPDPRALAYARKSTSPGARLGPPSSRRLAAPPAPAGGDRRAAPSLRTPRSVDGEAPAPVARPAIPSRGLSGAGAGEPHRSSRAIAAPPSQPRMAPEPRVVGTPHAAPTPRVVGTPHAAPAPRVVGTPHAAPAPRATPHRSTSDATPAPRSLPQAAPAPQISAPAARPRALPSAPSAPSRPRIHIPSGPAPGRAAPGPGRPRSR